MNSVERHNEEVGGGGILIVIKRLPSRVQAEPYLH